MNIDEILYKSRYGYKGETSMYKVLLNIIEKEKDRMLDILHLTSNDFMVRGVLEYAIDVLIKNYITKDILEDPTFTTYELMEVLESEYNDYITYISSLSVCNKKKYYRVISIVFPFVSNIYHELIQEIEEE